MVQIIPNNQRRSFGEEVLSGVNAAVPGIQEFLSGHENRRNQDLMRNQENEAAKRMGLDLSGISDPKMREKAFEFAMKEKSNESSGRRNFENQSKLQREKYGFENDLSGRKNELKAKELEGKRQESLAPLQAGLKTISEMRNIGSKGNLGRGSAIKGFFGGETGKDRATYERLGKSLISLSSNIPIRNKIEFETLAHDLFDPSIPDSAREGILDAMELIINQNMQQYESSEENQKEKPSLTSFER